MSENAKQKDIIEQDVGVSVVVKDGKVDNLVVDTVPNAIKHGKDMVNCYMHQEISQIVVVKRDKDGINEIMFEHIP